MWACITPSYTDKSRARSNNSDSVMAEQFARLKWCRMKSRRAAFTGDVTRGQEGADEGDAVTSTPGNRSRRSTRFGEATDAQRQIRLYNSTSSGDRIAPETPDCQQLAGHVTYRRDDQPDKRGYRYMCTAYRNFVYRFRCAIYHSKQAQNGSPLDVNRFVRASSLRRFAVLNGNFSRPGT